MKKQCAECGEKKSLSEFNKNKRTKDRLCYNCRDCNKKYNRIHKVELAERKKIYNRTEKGKSGIHRRNLKNKYGITFEQYDEMFEKQNGICAICGGININGRRLGVDHNHRTGQIRALLCNSCNHIIGDAKEDITILQSAINYLKSFET